MKSLAELSAIREKMKNQVASRANDLDGTKIIVGMATCGIAAGARPVLNAFVEAVAESKIENVTVAQTGCIGICQYEPVVEVVEPGKEKVTYVKVNPDMVSRIVAEHIVNGRPVQEYTIGAAEGK